MSDDSNPDTSPQAAGDKIPAASSAKYLTAPVASVEMPGGIPYIVGNEAAERFSFYGMKGILVVFMTKHLLDSSGDFDLMGDAEATYYYHLFTFSAYFFLMLGSLLSDVFLGKYRTILSLSIIYCLGHLVLAVDATRIGLAIGLSLIAIGSGGIKPCVTAHVGDQFGSKNQHLLSKVFSWFYFSINLGAFLSTLLTPLLLKHIGPHAAFGLPGLLMFIATVVFWMGRHKFVHVPAGGVAFLKETFSGPGLRAIANLSVLYLFVAMFWALFDQTGSIWVLQAQHLDRHFLWFEILPSQIQAINPIMILIGIPIFSYGVYPAIDRVFPLSPLRKISIGLFLAAASFAICAVVEARIAAGDTPYFGWQVLAYLVLTSAEIMVSITCLEFSYTQAPKKMKSFIMGLYLFSVSAGNLFTALINFFLQNEDGSSKLSGTSYYWFFTLAMLATACVFVVVARFYRGKTYIQDERA